jgi:large subunit ribosomal protein L28
MARRDVLTGKSVQSGNKVSHSNHKTRRRFLPNMQSALLTSEALGAQFSLRITPATIRSIDHNGGLDGFLLSTPSSKLTEQAAIIKRKVKKALLLKAAA